MPNPPPGARPRTGLATILRLTGLAIAVFGAWGVVVGLALHWANEHWPSEGQRRIAEAETRPSDRRFRPLNAASEPPAGPTALTYVPVYSTLYLGEREVQAGLAVTLSVRNTLPDRDLVVHRIAYFGSDGTLLSRVADRPHAVPPMATAEFFIDRRDPAGGAGANYLVEWSLPPGGTEPLIEAVMVGRARGAGITVVGRGRVVRPQAANEASEGR